MIVKFNPAGRVLWVFGRRKESADADTKPWEHPNPPLPPVDGMFRQPTDVAWDCKGNIYITDGYVNSRVAKYNKNGHWMKSWGEPAPVPASSTCRMPSRSTVMTTSMSATAPITASRCSTPTASFCACSRSTYRRTGTRAVYGTTPTGDRLNQAIGAPNSICIPPGRTR